MAVVTLVALALSAQTAPLCCGAWRKKPLRSPWGSPWGSPWSAAWPGAPADGEPASCRPRGPRGKARPGRSAPPRSSEARGRRVRAPARVRRLLAGAGARSPPGVGGHAPRERRQWAPAPPPRPVGGFPGWCTAAPLYNPAGILRLGRYSFLNDRIRDGIYPELQISNPSYCETSNS